MGFTEMLAMCRNLPTFSEVQKRFKGSLPSVVSSWGRTPRSSLAVNEVGVCVWRTDPPNRGVLFHPQTYTSFLASKVRGVLHPLATLCQSYAFCLPSRKFVK